jgi:hypothetical protein
MWYARSLLHFSGSGVSHLGCGKERRKVERMGLWSEVPTAGSGSRESCSSCDLHSGNDPHSTRSQYAGMRWSLHSSTFFLSTWFGVCVCACVCVCVFVCGYGP